MQEVILATVTDYLAKFRGEQYRLRHLTKQLAEEPERVLARDNMPVPCPISWAMVSIDGMASAAAFMPAAGHGASWPT